MLTIKLFLENSGRTLRLDKDFPVYQGQFNNILLNVFVPTDILAPYFTKYADVNDTIISPYVAGTSVCIGSKTIARNGTYKESKKYYLRFVKTLVKDGVSYALFERKLPKEFTTYAGENNIIVNVNNVEFGEIKSANATTDSTHFVLGDLDLSKVQENFPAVSLNYTFKYNGTEWLLNGEIAVLEAYGINIESGTPEINDEILLKVYAEKANTTNITTTQPVTMEVMASNQFDGEPAISTSELETLQAYINELVAVLSHKQDKQDNGLQTQIKTVVGAINELVHLVGTNERVIGTYNFISSVVDRLPTNEEMLDFVRSVMGATYELQGNEVVYTIKDYAGIKTTYKSIYSDDTNKWLFYEVTQIMSADNGVKGIVEGTYGLGYDYDTIVKISGGRIVDIVIKVDGEYVNIRDAFTTEKWVKDYCKNNYAPIQLSQQLYFSKQGENNVISTLVPTETTSVISGVLTSEAIEYELLKAKYTIPFDKLELTKDNKFRCILYVMANQDISVTFKLATKVNNEIVNVEKSTTKTLVQDKYIKLEFENPFDKIVDKQEVVLNDIIEVTLFMTKEESGVVTFTTISTPDYPATYSLLLDTKAIVSGKIEQELGNNENSVISQKATTNIVGNYLVMSISSTTGSITKTDFEYLKEEFEYNGKKAQHRGIIAVNGTEKMEYKFEIEKDNKLYFIGSKMVGEVLTFYEMEIVKATEETYNWTISNKKAGGTTVSPIETATGTETGIDGLKIDNESYRVKGTIKPLETMPIGVTPKEIAGLETDGETYEIPRKEIVFSDGAIPPTAIRVTQIKAIIDGVEKVFYFGGSGSGGEYITIQTITKFINGFNILYDSGSQFFLPIDDTSNVTISADGKALIFKGGSDVDGKTIVKGTDDKIETQIGGYYKKTEEVVFDGALAGSKLEDNGNIWKIDGTDGKTLTIDDIYNGEFSSTAGTVPFENHQVTSTTITGLTTGTTYDFNSLFIIVIEAINKPLMVGSYNNALYAIMEDTDLTPYMAINPAVKLVKVSEELEYIKGQVIPIDNSSIIFDEATGKLKSVSTIAGAMKYKGSCFQADLPTTHENGDYWTLADTEGEYKGQCAIWSDDHNAWQYSSSGITVDTALSDTSTNPVQNKTLKTTIDKLVTTDTAQTISGQKSFEKAIILSGGIGNIKLAKDNTSAVYYGGSADGKGATLWLHGNDYAMSAYKGGFDMSATKADGSHIRLTGKRNGSLTWNDKEILREDTGVTLDTEQTITGKKSFDDDKLYLGGWKVLNQMSGVEAENGWTVDTSKLALFSRTENGRVKHFTYTRFVEVESPTSSATDLFYCIMCRTNDENGVLYALTRDKENPKMYANIMKDGFFGAWKEIFAGGGAGVTLDTAQEITGQKTFTQTIVSKNDTTMLKDNDTGCMQIGGGSGTLNGANLLMFGDNWSGEDDKGAFYLYATKGGGERIALAGKKDGSLNWNSEPVVVAKNKGNAGQILVSKGDSETAEWTDTASGSPKYMHSICASDADTATICFQFINGVSTPYTTVAQISRALYDLGFRDKRSTIIGNGMNFTMAYGTETGNFYYYKVSSSQWANSGWNKIVDNVSICTSAGGETAGVTLDTAQTITGQKTFSSTVLLTGTDSIARNEDNNAVRIHGGQIGKSGRVVLCGKDIGSGLNGCFFLDANDGTSSKRLLGKPDGTLTWGGNDITGSDKVTLDTVQTISEIKKFSKPIISDCEIAMAKPNATGDLVLCGGPDKTLGASLQLAGANNGNKGLFYLLARNSDGAGALMGKPDGTLTWNSEDIIHRISGNHDLPLSASTYDISFAPASGVSIETWGTGQTMYRYASQTEAVVTMRVKCNFNQTIAKGDYMTIGNFKYNNASLPTTNMHVWAYGGFQNITKGTTTGLYCGGMFHMTPDGTLYVSNMETEDIKIVSGSTGFYVTMTIQFK